MKQRVSNTIESLRLILTREQREILKTALLLMIPVLFTKFTALIETALQATKLGNTQARNNFILADTIPDALTNILFLGVIGVVVVPVFIEIYESEGKERFFKVYNTMLNLTLILFLSVTVLIFLFADQAMPWLMREVIRPAADTVPSNPQDYAAMLAEVAAMMKALMFSNIILGISVYVSSGLQTFHRVLVPQLAPLFFNLGKIIGIVILFPLMNRDIWALVYGIMLGACLHLFIQLPLAKMLDFSYSFTLNWRDKYVRRIFALTIPRVMAIGADQLVIVFADFIATRYGAISAFDYATKLAYLIPAIFGFAFAQASLPTLTELWSKHKHSEIALIISRTVNQIIFLAAPFVVTTIILRLPVVRLVLGFAPGTLFNRTDTALVGWILLFLAIGLIFTSLKWYLYRVFFAAKDSWVPMLLSLSSLVITIFLGSGISNLLSFNTDYDIATLKFDWEHFTTSGGHAAGAGGIAIAISIAAMVEVTLQLILIHRRVVPLDWMLMLKNIGIKLIPLLVMSTLMFIMYKTWDTISFPIDATPGFTGSTTLNLFLLTSITVGTCFMVYYLLCYLFQIEELKILRKLLNPVFKLGGLRIE